MRLPLLVAMVLAVSSASCGGQGPDPNTPTQAPPTQAPPPAQPAPQQAAAAEPGPPPSVLSGDGHLDCTISAKENGHQKLQLKGGQGLEFDVAVSPIVDGVVETKGPDQGGSYHFTSHLAGAGKGTLSGVGDVTLEQLETKVNVEMNRYDQPKGPGTELTFRSEDMARRGVYIEFSGKAVAPSGDRYAFKITLGAAGPGSGGKVQPASDASKAPIVAKMVVVEAPSMTVVTTTLRKLP
jgi:hypothetical protein